MKKIPVQFFFEGVSFRLQNRTVLQHWINSTLRNEKKKPEALNFIFCTDKFLLSYNQQYLNHDTFTDIITFDHSSEKNKISGDIFISYERVKENANKFQTKVVDELHRVMIHGVLHLCGYSDKTTTLKKKMVTKENFYLGKRTFAR